ncbi:MAG: Bug family tripartite tricarboxylate transporter substrate binding protein [Xanthobacteraceae bacterium]
MIPIALALDPSCRSDTSITYRGADMRGFRFIPFLLVCTIAAVGASGAAGADYPDRPVRLIVPQAAGSATDTVARILGAELGKELGQQVVVDNRPGGALTIGLDLTAKAEPDGYTVCMGPIGALAITRHMVAKLPYDIERDFQPIALVTRGHLLLAVAPTLSIKSVPELIAYAKANPGKLLNASSSNGSPGHVGGELFKFMTATDIVHVPYRGGANAINDLIAGRVHLMFESLNSIASHATAGTVRALAVSGARRSPAFPDLPTVAEAGVPGYEAPTWSGVIGPAGLPRPIVDKLNAAINRAIASPAFRQRFAAIGDEPAGGTPEEFAQTIAKDSAKWAEVVARSGAKLD